MNWLGKWFGLVGAGVSMALSVGLSVHTILFLAKGVRTAGEIIEMRERRSREDDGSISITYAPVFVFADGSGKRHEVQSSHSSRPARYQVGDRVPVIYPESNPDRARINRFFENWMGSMVTAFLALVFAFAHFARGNWIRHRQV